MAEQPTGPDRGPARRDVQAVAGAGGSSPRVSSKNRKLCAACGADVTFARRGRAADGKPLCLTCAATAGPAVEPALAMDQVNIEGAELTCPLPPPLAADGTLQSQFEDNDGDAMRSRAVFWVALVLIAVGGSVGVVVWQTMYKSRPSSPGHVVVAKLPAPPRASGEATKASTIFEGSAASNKAHVAPTVAIPSSVALAPPISPADQARSLAALRAQAADAFQKFKAGRIGQEFTTRGIRRRSRIGRDLAALWVKADRVDEPGVRQSVDRISAATDRATAGERSDTLVTGINDRAMFDLLGVLCEADTAAPGLATQYAEIRGQMMGRISGKASPDQRVCAYSCSSMQALQAIAAARGIGANNSLLQTPARTQISSADAAGRSSAMNYENASRILQLLTANHGGKELQPAEVLPAAGNQAVMEAACRARDNLIEALHQLVCP